MVDFSQNSAKSAPTEFDQIHPDRNLVESVLTKIWPHP